MESLFSTLKPELVYRKSLRTREEAENELFAYIAGWYKTKRIQARLGWLSPDELDLELTEMVDTWRAKDGVLDDHALSPADGADPAPVS